MDATRKKRREMPRVRSAPASTVVSGWYRVPSLRAVRLRNNMSQAELARRSGCGQPTISKLEWADHRAQSVTVLKLAEALGTLPSELLREPVKVE